MCRKKVSHVFSHFCYTNIFPPIFESFHNLIWHWHLLLLCGTEVQESGVSLLYEWQRVDWTCESCTFHKLRLNCKCLGCTKIATRLPLSLSKDYSARSITSCFKISQWYLIYSVSSAANLTTAFMAKFVSSDSQLSIFLSHQLPAHKWVSII